MGLWGRAGFIGVLLCVVAAFGLTNGPTQQEFTSFEPVDATDLVNLPTGDFSYVLPLGDVKGPAGVGYPVVLSYHAGILHDQEASWVGLGWTLNVGAINRSVQGFPDDYNANTSIQYLFNHGDYTETWDIGAGVYGVEASVGWSYKGSEGELKFDGLTSLGGGYSQGGFSVGGSVNFRNGSMSAGIGYGNQFAKIGVGVSISADGEVSGNVNIGIRSGQGANSQNIAGFSMSSQGSGIGLSAGDATVGFGSMTLSDKGIHAESWGAGASISVPIYGVWVNASFNYSMSSWYYAGMEYGNVFGYLFSSTGDNIARQKIVTDNDILLNAANNSDATGQWCYTNDIANSCNNIIGASKISADGINKCRDQTAVHFEHQYDKFEYLKGSNYNLPAQDIYGAVGQGLMGVFKPFSYSALRSCYSPEAAYDGIVGIPESGQINTIDQPFRYTEQFNNQASIYSSRFQDGITFKMLNEVNLNLVDEIDDELSYSVSTTSEGYGSDELSNLDLEVTTTISMPKNTFGTKIEPLFGFESNMEDKLCGFIITDQQGKSYYYTLPLFLLQEVAFTNNVPDYPKAEGVMTFNKSHSYKATTAAYATSWLLTAVTGPDYIKMNNLAPSGSLTLNPVAEAMMPHEGDLGYWVAFQYEYGDDVIDDENHKPVIKEGTIIGKSSYQWRAPFYDSKDIANAASSTFKLPHLTDDCSSLPADKRYYSGTFGMKEVTYLKAIETSSEVAYFRTSPRLDGYGADSMSYPQFLPNKIDLNLCSWDMNNKEWAWDHKRVFPYSFTGYSHGMILDATEENLERCIQIKIPKDLLSVSKFNDQMKNGDPIMLINFGARANYKVRAWIWQFLSIGLWRSPDKSMDWYKDESFEVLRDKSNTSEVAGTISKFDFSFWKKTANDFDKNSGTNNISKQLKCFYAKEEENYTVLYITNYDTRISYYDRNGNWTTDGWKSTLLDLDFPNELLYESSYWTPDKIDAFYISSVWLSGKNQMYNNINTKCRYTKKLDEVAWYSKSKYPFLNRLYDPGDPSALEVVKQAEFYPQAYRSVKFRYDYSLAQGTTNSVADGKGRLTLKEVRAEAGSEEKPMVMPPYLFSYQNANIQYLGFDKIDPWGFQKAEPNGVQTEPGLGVNWNLSKILLPSCGAIDIEYERDQVNSYLGTLYRMKTDNVCLDKKDAVAIPVDPLKPYTNDYLVESFSSEQNKIVLSNTSNMADIEPGMFLIAYFHSGNLPVKTVLCCNESIDPNCGSFGAYTSYTDFYSYNCYKYLYEIESVDKLSFSITLKTTLFQGPGSLTKVHVLKSEAMVCDGIRVKKLSSSSNVDNKRSVLYKYPVNGGTINVLPNIALPVFLRDSSHSKVISGHCGQCGNEPVINPPSGGSGVDFGGTPTVGGGSLPPPPPPIDPIVISTENGRLVVDSCSIDYAPFSMEAGKNFYSSFSQVLYPVVSVEQVASDNITNTGGVKKYYFWTPNDKVTVNDKVTGNDVSAPLINEYEFTNTTGIKIHQVIDRLGIVGQPKKTEFYKKGKNTKPVYEKTFTYTFSDELAAKAGVYNESLDDNKRLTSSSPLGAIRERSIRLERENDISYPAKSIADVITFKPFLTAITEKTDDVTVTTQFGWFDARTGGAMATLSSVVKAASKKSSVVSVNAVRKFVLSVPLHYLDWAKSAATSTLIKKKNTYALNGGSLVAELPSSGTGAINAPKDVNYTSLTTMANGYIKSANVQFYNEMPVPMGTFAQASHFWLYKTALWKGTSLAAFTWPASITTLGNDWQTQTTIAQIDGYSRPLTELDVLNNASSATYHPRMNAIVGVVKNAAYKEYAVYTCDYEDQGYIAPTADNLQGVDKSKLDFINNWMRNQSVLSSAVTHFGQMSVHVKASTDGKNEGPSKQGITIKANTDYYIFSAWVYPVTVSATDPICLAVEKVGATSNTAIGTADAEKMTTLVSGSTKGWQFVSRRIKSTDFTAGDKIRILICSRTAMGTQTNAEYYVDDIRFYPANALLSTFYYDANLGVPITLVDPKNHASYSKYDAFGRLIEKGFIKE